MIQIKKNNFKIESFINSTLSFLKEHNCPESDPSVWIVWTDKNDTKVQYGPTTGRDNFMQQLQEGKSLFFRFSTECFDSEITCVNGETYECADANDEDSKSIISERDFLGYSVSLVNNEYKIELAIHSGEMFPYPEQIVKDEVGEYESVMKKHIEKFIVR